MTPVLDPETQPPTGEGAGGPHASEFIVGVGASAGGLEAFSELLKNLPTNTLSNHGNGRLCRRTPNHHVSVLSVRSCPTEANKGNEELERIKYRTISRRRATAA